MSALALSAASASAASLAPPPYELMDRHGVNVATGQVSPSLTDVSIGGSTLGLSHSISTFSSNFVNWEGEGPLGYRDRFYGRVMRSIHHKPPNTEYHPENWVYVMRVFDIGGSIDFSINPDGTYVAYNGDPRQTLEFRPGFGFVWTKSDGTVVTFRYAGDSFPSGIIGPIAGVSEIKYPNGFTVTVSSTDVGALIFGAATNTGYQLKYVYTPQNVVLELPDDPTNDHIPGVAGWTMPRYVAAINNAIDFCPMDTIYGVYNSLSDACGGQLTQEWPKATYNWPGGMPRVMFLGETVFSVIDANGGVTEYTSRPYQMPFCPTVDGGTRQDDPKYRTPRIVAIKNANSTVPAINYEYISKCFLQGLPQWWSYFSAGPIAQVASSYIGSDVNGYSIGNPYTPAEGVSPTTSINGGGGYRGINYVYTNIDFGISKFDAWDKFAAFEQMRSNRLLSVTDKLSGAVTEPGYDARYNVTSIKRNGAVIQTAGYPSTCDSRKTCNQATWVKDANGNQTDYEYDPNSGQITRMRMPADRNGIRPETRYTYDPKYAYYKDSTGAYQQAPSPIYLLTRERKCLTTATLGDGSGCAGGAVDEIVFDYDYGPSSGPNNLNLRGMAVTAYVDGAVQVRRTCYAYDIYGNRIGETKPQAGLTSCTPVRGRPLQ